MAEQKRQQEIAGVKKEEEEIRKLEELVKAKERYEKMVVKLGERRRARESEFVR